MRRAPPGRPSELPLRRAGHPSRSFALLRPGGPDRDIGGSVKSSRRAHLLPSSLFPVVLLAAGCGGGGESSTGGSGGHTGTTGTGASSTGGTGGGGASTNGGSAGSGGDLFGGCKGAVCGQGDCCDATQECVLGGCLPACASKIRCGADLSVCCGSGEVCVAGGCVAPGAPCTDWADCAENEFCEPTLGACLPQPEGIPACEYKPPTGPLLPTIEWSWTETPLFPAFVQVINMPVVVDLEKDGTPDVVIVTSDSYDPTKGAYLRALDGATGAEKWDAANDVYKDANRAQPRVTPAAADIDGDGFVEIVTGKVSGGLIAFEHDGTFKWASTKADGTAWNVALASAAVAIADLEGDGKPEIVIGGFVFDATGKLLVDGGALFGANGTYGPVSIVADLDGALPQEIVGGRKALRSDGTLYWDNGLSDGYTAIADLDLDGTPEIVVVSTGKVRVQSPTTGVALAEIDMPGSGAGGPPTIADFDADGVPEIASANGDAYSVFEYTSSPMPTLTVKWQSPTQDLSSNRTGSSVFDFQGDGAAEVVYNDECYFRVYDGKDGTVLYKEANSSATILEYPVVVDVDGDNNTEVVLSGNDLNTMAGTCPYPVAEARHGVFVYGDADDNWVRTRRLWNQHAYHITNIEGDGSIPAPEPASWIAPAGLNNYRQSSQGAGVFNAPDLQVGLEASLAPCPAAVTLSAVVRNQGSLGVAAGVSVRFYRGSGAAAVLIKSTVTQGPLLPGQAEVVTAQYTVLDGETVLDFSVDVDSADPEPGAFKECLEANNTATLSGVECPAVN